jgi:hypothetical protein
MGKVKFDGTFEVQSLGVRPSEGGNGAQLGWYHVAVLDLAGSHELQSNVHRRFLST